MNLKKDLPELIVAGIIDETTAQNIQAYYQKKENESPNKLVIAFGIIGAFLVGLGIILIVAHNWDYFPRTVKIGIAFLPVLLGLLFSGIAVFLKKGNIGWKEGSALFLVLSIGACISLISQTYQVSGTLSSFLFTWLLLSLPVFYVLESVIAAILFLVGITAYQITTVYNYPKQDEVYYWLFLLSLLPFYLNLVRQQPSSNAVSAFNWLLPVSITISLGGIAQNNEELLFIGYMSLFGLFYLIGRIDIFSQNKPINNGYRFIGIIGTIAILYICSFKWFWENLSKSDLECKFSIPEYLTALLLSFASAFMFFFQNKSKSFISIDFFGSIFILFIALFTFGFHYILLPLDLTNLLLLGIGIFFIYKGFQSVQLSTMNFGLIILSILIICRFFDTEMSFVNRGLVFIGIGVGFFFANYKMIQINKSR